MEYVLFLTVLALLAIANKGETNDFLRVCYYTNWSRYRPSPYARFDLEDIDPFLCTHLVYAFAKIDGDSLTLTPIDPIDEESTLGFQGRFERFNNLKQQNPKLKTLLSIGGETGGVGSFIAVSRTESTARTFAKNTEEFLTRRGFDGVDVDWEFPNTDTKDSFVRLLRVMRDVFDAASPRLSLFAAVAAGKWTIDSAYDVQDIARYVDIVNIMTYDFHVIGSEVSAFNSPLSSRDDPRFSEFLSVNYSLHYWHKLGMPYSKMAVGVTGVGRHFILKDQRENSVGSPVTKQVVKGELYSLPGGLAYPEICLMRSDPNTVVEYDTHQQVPYLYNNYSWVGYENPHSARLKGKYMRNLGVAGVMFWALDQDDFTGQACEEGKYPLLHAILDGLGVSVPTATTFILPSAPTYIPHRSTTRVTQATSSGPDSVTRQALDGAVSVHMPGWWQSVAVIYLLSRTPL